MSILNKIKLLSVLSEADLDFVRAKMEVRYMKKGETLFSPLDKCYSLNFVLDGQVKLCKFSSDGREQIISTMTIGNIFGEALVFEGLSYPVHVIAEKDSSIGILRRDTILELTQRNREFTLIFFEELSKKIRILNEKLEFLSYPAVKQRLAKFLLNMSKEQDSKKIRLKVSKQKIAQILGTSREVVSRNFSIMEREGYLEIKEDFLLLYIEEIESLL